MPISTVSLSNTFFHWLLTTNSVVGELNKIESGDYFKTSNTIYITSPGVGLSVVNTASFGTVSANSLVVSANASFANLSITTISANSGIFTNLSTVGNTVSLSTTIPRRNVSISINRGESANSANADAILRWNESSRHWEIRDVNSSNNYFRLPSSNNTRFGVGTSNPTTSLHINANDAIIIPSGSDIQRPSGVNGMIRYNTSNNYIEMYSNNQWSIIGSGAGGSAIIRQQYIATANQVSFTVDGGYSPGQLDVFYNGVKLLNGNEVDVSTGSVFTLSTEADAGSVVEVVGLKSYTITGAASSPVRQIYSANSGQTIFSVNGGYTPGQIDVYYNGSKLVNGSDVNVSSGSNFVLSSGATTGAIVEVVGISAINYTDAVKKSGDTITGDLTIYGTLTANNFASNTFPISYIQTTGTANSNTFLTGSSVWRRISATDLGAGTANANTYLAGDGSWKPVISGATLENDVSSNTVYYIGMTDSSSGTWSNAYVSDTQLYFNANTGTLSATIFNSLSDKELKENFESIENSLEIINKVNPIGFNWKGSGKKSYGVIAQELEKILPELVSDNNGIKSVEYNSLMAFLIGAVQEMSERLDKLENK